MLTYPQEYLLSATELHSLWLTDQEQLAQVNSIQLTGDQRMGLRYRGWIPSMDGELTLCCLLASKPQEDLSW